jgi:hypothetical protein
MAAAARLSIAGIGFSAPGLGYSTKTFGFTPKDLIEHTLNVIPLSDPVPTFDKQIGASVNVDCNAGQPIDCHSLSRTLKQLISKCGA